MILLMLNKHDRQRTNPLISLTIVNNPIDKPNSYQMIQSQCPKHSNTIESQLQSAPDPRFATTSLKFTLLITESANAAATRSLPGSQFNIANNAEASKT